MKNDPTPRQVLRDQAALDAAALAAETAVEASLEALTRAETTEARAAGKRAVRAATDALRGLLTLGAETKHLKKARALQEAKALDLSRLALMDTPAARRLLALLSEAQEAAEQVDWERGKALPESVPLQSGESRGTDYAESVSYLVLRLRREVEGPNGRE